LKDTNNNTLRQGIKSNLPRQIRLELK